MCNINEREDDDWDGMKNITGMEEKYTKQEKRNRNGLTVVGSIRSSGRGIEMQWRLMDSVKPAKLDLKMRKSRRKEDR